MKGRAFRAIASLSASLIVLSLMVLTTHNVAYAGPLTSVCEVATVSRACSAEIARYTELAEFYTARQFRSFRAVGARYTGLAEVYAARATARQRALSAETARYTGLISAQHLRADQATNARYTGLAGYYDASFGARRAESARNTGLALRYASFGD